MSNINIERAEAYYIAMKNKDVPTVEALLHPHVEFTGPLATLEGKEAVVEAAKNFMDHLTNLHFRAKVGSEDQVMLALDVEFSPPLGKFPAAVYMNFKDDLISRIELFYDGRLLEVKKEAIFS